MTPSGVDSFLSFSPSIRLPCHMLDLLEREMSQITQEGGRTAQERCRATPAHVAHSWLL